MEFDGFIGNSSVKQRLSHAFRSGQLSHSYLLLGPEGSGKKTLARILSMAMECTSGAQIPCGVCTACRKVKNDTHPDVIWVDDDERKTVSVDLIRQARSDAFIRPNEGKRKIYILPRAQDLTEAAQNALLKILEEPPAYGAFILLSGNSEKLLPTIRSRCVELHLGPIDTESAVAYLQEQYPAKTRQELQAALTRAGGYLGQAQQILQGEILLPQTEQAILGYARKDSYAVLQALLPMDRWKREQVQQVLQQMRLLLCDAMQLRAHQMAVFSASKTLLEKRTGAQLLQAAENLQKAMDALDCNAAVGAVIGWLCVHLR